MEGAWLLGRVSGLGAPGSLVWEVPSLVGPDGVDSAGRQRGAACSPEGLQLEGQGGRPGEAESGGGPPEVPPPSRVSRNRREGAQEGAVFQVCGLGGYAWCLLVAELLGKQLVFMSERGDHVSGQSLQLARSNQHAHPHLPKQGAQPPAVPTAWSLGGRWPGCRGGPRQAVVSSVS